MIRVSKYPLKNISIFLLRSIHTIRRKEYYLVVKYKKNWIKYLKYIPILKMVLLYSGL